MKPAATTNPTTRDRRLQRVRAASWALGAAAAGLTGAFSVVAAHAFKGHHGGTSETARASRSAPAPAAAVHVPPPQHVPAIAGAPALQPPAAAPETPAPVPQTPSAPVQQAPAPAPAPAPVPQTSGGS